MLTVVLTDIEGRQSTLYRPLKLSLVSEGGAPADALKAVFAVSGSVPAFFSAEVINNGEQLFLGFVDQQDTEYSEKGMLLTITARSRACLLLDNEARPQTYIKPSMPLLMKRHFAPLGFTDYAGTDRPFIGQLTVVKGMSEWAVLCRFCELFLHIAPKIRRNGVIDVSGEDAGEILTLSAQRIVSYTCSLKNRVLISDILARTHIRGAYTMPLKSEKARLLGIRRKRYVDSFDSKSRSVLTAQEMLRKSEAAYETVTAECSGCFFCETGTTLRLPYSEKDYCVREVVYTYDLSGEKTRIIAEVKHK